ncbi:MAG TPA: globin-coupled sensor protein, partial [Rhodopila sp.]
MPSDHDLSDRLKFLGIGDAARATLTEFLPTLQHELPGIILAFYKHIRQWPQLSGMFRTEADMTKASAAQTAHWLKLYSGRFDDDYASSVHRIGHVHSRLGLEPRWYMGGYAFVLGRLYTVASHTFMSRLNPAAAQAKTAALISCLNQVAILDMDLAISTYIEANKATYDARLATLADAFTAQIGPLVHGVTAQSEALRNTAGSMSAAAEETDCQATAVAAAAEEASANVQTVATATEQLHASASEISRQIDRSTRITDAAVEAAQNSNATVQTLSSAARKIGDVVTLISAVANQTNLL